MGQCSLDDINLHTKQMFIGFLPVFPNVMNAVVIRDFVIAKKKVNDNIIGARWQDIRLRGEIIAVNRHIGGL